MKIAFLSRFVGQVHRGAETYVLELAKRLEKSHQVEILAGTRAGSLPQIIGGRYDLVIPTNGRLQAAKASFGRIFGRYKTIISGQAGVGRDDIWNIAFTCPDVYVALTDYQAQWAQRWAFRCQIVKIPNGVDLQKFTPVGSRIRVNLPKPVVLSVGALEWYKHHELTIEAMAKTEKGSLMIIGSGSEREKLQKLGNDLLGQRRFRLISVTHEDMPPYYRSADVFVLPSWEREAFGIVYLEAMASSLPVVAPDDLARQEIVGQGGILVKSIDAAAYCQAILAAYAKKWRRLPRKQAEKFSWDLVANQYEELFKKLK